MNGVYVVYINVPKPVTCVVNYLLANSTQLLHDKYILSTYVSPMYLFIGSS